MIFDFDLKSLFGSVSEILILIWNRLSSWSFPTLYVCRPAGGRVGVLAAGRCQFVSWSCADGQAANIDLLTIDLSMTRMLEVGVVWRSRDHAET